MKSSNLSKARGSPRESEKWTTEKDLYKKSLSKTTGELMAKTKKGFLENFSLLQVIGTIFMAWGVYTGLVFVGALPYQYVIFNVPLSTIPLLLGIACFGLGYFLFKL